ncbi:MAG: biopolymer transporter ExbD [Rhodocyclales bacterium]|nr:biopolymer transporter ExbD [Rhodocyclales bacterium]
MKFRQRGDSCEEPYISLVPLIDVVLVILIFLSVTTTFSQTAQLKIDLPEADAAAPADTAPKEWVVAITAEGSVFVGERAVGFGSVEDIEAALTAVIPAGSNPTLVIEADARTPHQRVIDVMRAAQRAGFDKLTFSVERVESR